MATFFTFSVIKTHFFILGFVHVLVLLITFNITQRHISVTRVLILCTWFLLEPGHLTKLLRIVHISNSPFPCMVAFWCVYPAVQYPFLCFHIRHMLTVLPLIPAYHTSLLQAAMIRVR